MNREKTKVVGRRGEVSWRFDLELAPPTDDSTNEFSFVELEKERARKENPVLETSLSRDPLLEDSNEEIAAIARRFEEKYAPRKGKRILHESDLIDRGSGYDATDSFIDDAEVYEDIIPHQLDTKFGGFYINTGGLEFKPADDLVDDDELDFITKRKPAKPKIKKVPSFQTPQAILASQKLKKAKQRAALQKNPVSNKNSQTGLGDISSANPPPLKKRKQNEPKCIFPSNGGVVDPFTGSSPLIGNGQSVTPGPEQLRMQDAGTHMVNLTPKLGIGVDATKLSPTLEVPVKAGGVVSNPLQVPRPPSVLPDKLPPVVLTKVITLEKLIEKDQGADGKLSNKARMNYDEHLVDIHLHCRNLSMKIKNAIFEYLAYRMGVARGTLIKRMKQELKKREDSELEKCILDLKRAIDASMQEQIDSYEKEVKARVESMSSQAEKIMEVDEENDVFDDSSMPSQPLSSQEKVKKAPRKRFKWTDDIRRLLCNVVMVKVTCEERTISRTNKGNGEEIISTFLEERIKPLWPKGWMQKGILYKASEIAHKHFTNPPLVKKAIPVKKDKPIMKQQVPPITLVSVQQGVPGVSLSTATAPTVQQSSSASKISSLDSQVSNIKKELEKLASKKVGGVAGPTAMKKPEGICLGTSPMKVVVKPIAIPSTTAQQLSKSKTTDSFSAKPHNTKPLSVNSRKIAKLTTSKSSEVISLSPRAKSNPVGSSVSNSVANPLTYLLSTKSLNISQLLQAHLQQQNSATTTPTIQGKQSTLASQTPSSWTDAKTKSKGNENSKIVHTKKVTESAPIKPVLNTTSKLVAQDQVLTVVSTGQATGTAPVIQLLQSSTSQSTTKSGGAGKTVSTAPSSQMLSAAGIDKLDHVLNKLVASAISTKVAESSASAISTRVAESSTMTTPIPIQLNLTKQKQPFSSPQVIFPAQINSPTSTWKLLQGVSHTQSSTGGVIQSTPPTPTSTGRLLQKVSPSPPTSAEHTTIPADVHVTPTTLPAGPIGVHVPSRIMSVVPDTPQPLFIPTISTTQTLTQTTRQVESPLSLSPCQSPLKSPVEQILEEHSYLGPGNKMDLS